MKINSVFRFYCCLSSNGDSAESVNATSNEILQDVLRQLNKLEVGKRNKILNELRKHNPDAFNDPQSIDVTTDTTLKSDKLKIKDDTLTNDDSIKDDVETVNKNDLKMGTYKRKRSECSAQNFSAISNVIFLQKIK